MMSYLIPYEILLSQMKTSISVAAVALMYWLLIPYHTIMGFFRFLPEDFLESIFWSKCFWTAWVKLEQVAEQETDYKGVTLLYVPGAY